MAKKQDPALPEVRQCTDPASHFFGAVAIKSGLPNHAWGIFQPGRGGMWAPDDQVVGSWATLKVSR